MPHTWFLVEAGANDKVFVKVNKATSTCVATIPAGNYSMKDLGLAIIGGMNVVSAAEFLRVRVPRHEACLKGKTEKVYASTLSTIFTDAALKTMGSPYVRRPLNALFKNLSQTAYATAFPAT